jgi:heme exporter protein A
MKAASRNGFIVEIKQLEKRFGFKPVLRKLNLTVRNGDFLALFGPNGAGKTTLIQILCTLMQPTSGTVYVAGFDTRYHRESISKSMGIISHHPFLYSNLTADENLRFYGIMYGVGNLNERIQKLFEIVGLSAYANERVQTFSRGMQQRLSLARAIIHDPEILLLDEPYTGLDQRGADTLRHILASFQQQGKTAIMTSHDLNRGMELCNRAAILNSGKLVYDESVDDTVKNSFPHTYSALTQRKPLTLSIDR